MFYYMLKVILIFISALIILKIGAYQFCNLIEEGTNEE
jgi:hypothetical protein